MTKGAVVVFRGVHPQERFLAEKSANSTYPRGSMEMLANKTTLQKGENRPKNAKNDPSGSERVWLALETFGLQNDTPSPPPSPEKELAGNERF